MLLVDFVELDLMDFSSIHLTWIFFYFINQVGIVSKKKMIDLIYYLTVRCSDLANQPPEIASVVSIQLAVPRSFVTKSIDVSLIETQVLAWKTQITSLQGMLYSLLWIQPEIFMLS